jgi:hypothetical protein
MSFVDNDIVLHKRKAPAPKVTKNSSDINAARRVGGVVDVHTKCKYFFSILLNSY